MNLVVIIADTLRRDRLAFYREDVVREGNRRGRPADVPWPDRLAQTPNLDHLAARSAIFDRFYTASFPTMPCRADYLTGKWTFSYMTWEPLARTEITLPQILGEAGFTTVGVADTPFYMFSGYGYDRGFDFFYDLNTQWKRSSLMAHPRASEYEYCAPRTFAQAEKVLERIYDRPFLL